MSQVWPMLAVLGLLMSQAGTMLMLHRLQRRVAASELRELYRDRGVL
ncbi:hypothetical protein [Mesorhizobium sp. M0088]